MVRYPAHFWAAIGPGLQKMTTALSPWTRLRQIQSQCGVKRKGDSCTVNGVIFDLILQESTEGSGNLRIRKDSKIHSSFLDSIFVAKGVAERVTGKRFK